jgi:hypothetical protein
VARTVVALLFAGLGAVLSAYSPDLDQRAIQDAVAIGHERNDDVRARFHLSYRVHVADAPVDYIEVITPFRRLVLAAEERGRIGDRFFSQRDALALLARHGEGIEIAVELTFHPQNTYVGMPDYGLMLMTDDGDVIPARGLERLPRFTLRVTGWPLPGAGPGLAPIGQPLLGGTVFGRFAREDIDPDGTYAVVLSEMRKELARGRIGLAAIR